MTLKLFHAFEDIQIYHWKVGTVPVYYCDDAQLPERDRGYWFTTDPDGAIPYNFDVREQAIRDGFVVSTAVFHREDPAFHDVVVTQIRNLLCNNSVPRNKVMEDVENKRKAAAQCDHTERPVRMRLVGGGSTAEPREVIWPPNCPNK